MLRIFPYNPLGAQNLIGGQSHGVLGSVRTLPPLPRGDVSTTPTGSRMGHDTIQQVLPRSSLWGVRTRMVVSLCMRSDSWRAMNATGRLELEKA
jgi:hypothetical protein